MEALNISIIESDFNNFTAKFSGGAIYFNQYASSINLIKVKFININSLFGKGGVLYTS
jgi:predicted outer membrane repeat protein